MQKNNITPPLRATVGVPQHAGVAAAAAAARVVNTANVAAFVPTHQTASHPIPAPPAKKVRFSPPVEAVAGYVQGNYSMSGASAATAANAVNSFNSAMNSFIDNLRVVHNNNVTEKNVSVDTGSLVNVFAKLREAQDLYHKAIYLPSVNTGATSSTSAPAVAAPTPIPAAAPATVSAPAEPVEEGEASN